MKPGRISLYVQLGFAILYLAMGFLMLLHPAFAVKFDPTLRIGLGIILLAYAGFRLFGIYKKFTSPYDDH